MKPTGYQIFRFAKNTLGLNTRDTLAGMPVNSSSDLLNVEFDKTGSIRKRRGYTKLNSAALSEQNCVGLVNFLKTTTSGHYAISVWDDKIYKMDDYDGTWDDITGAVAPTSDQNYFQSFAIGQDVAVGTNGIDAPWKWTGSGNAAALSISNFSLANYVIYHKNRLIFAGTTEAAVKYPNRIRWSTVGTLETYASSDFSDEAESADSSEIVGMIKFLDEVYIFKNSFTSGIKRLIHTGNEDDPFVIVNVASVGAVSGRSLVNVDIPGVGSGILYWGVDNKVRFFNGNQSVPLSDHIQPTLDDLNITRNKYIQAVNYPALNQVWFTVSNGSSTTHNRIIVYDYLNKAFLIYDNIAANCLAILTDTSDVQYLVSGNYGGRAYQHNDGNNDDGSGFTSYYWTAWLDLGEPHRAKKFRWIDLYVAEVGNYNLNIGYNFNFNSGMKKSSSVNLNVDTATFGTAFFGQDVFGGQEVIIKRLPVYGTGRDRYIRFKFFNNNADEPFTLYRFDIIAKFLGLNDPF